MNFLPCPRCSGSGRVVISPQPRKGAALTGACAECNGHGRFMWQRGQLVTLGGVYRGAEKPAKEASP